MNPQVETWVKIFGPLLTGVGILVGVWQFVERSNAERRAEFDRNMYALKLDAYTKVGDLIGEILNHAQAGDTLAFDSCQTHFNALYWGTMPLADDSKVEPAMVEFKGMMGFFRKGENPLYDLNMAAYVVMKRCQRSLQQSSWEGKDGTTARVAGLGCCGSVREQ
jgi:hypothetical protein